MSQKFLTRQAIILAAGESTRFWPLNKKHKSLFEIMGRPLIDFILENLQKSGVKEVIIVQGPSRDIEKELGQKTGVKYAVQPSPKGTGDALKAAQKHLKEKFLVLYGDDFYGVDDLKKCFAKFPSLLVKEVKNPGQFGVIVKEKNYIKGIMEKPKNPPSNLVNAGGYFVPKTILNQKITRSARGEYEITDYVKQFAQKTRMYFSKASTWFPLSFDWDLFNMSEFLLSKIKTEIRGKIEKNCHIKGQVFVGERTVVKSGTYIEGPAYVAANCQLGPNCFIRPFTCLAQGCFIGHAVEIKNSIVGSGSRIAHLSYVADSIIGDNCNLGGGTILANLRLDGQNVRSTVKGKSIDTGRKKFGAVLGSNVQVGVNSSLMPGVLVGKNSIIGPHSLVRENIEDNSVFYSKFQKFVKKVEN